MPFTDQARYCNPYTDFGFKRLFGNEMNKEILIDFLNVLLHLDSPIKEIQYKNTENFGHTQEERKAVFDVYCQSENGEYFIVEMQKAMQHFFIDRSIYYSTFPIQEQARRGTEWDYRLKAVYTVGILDFVFDKDDPAYYHHEVKLMDVNTHKVLTDKLNLVYLEMPKFNKTIEECETLLDKIMFVLKNLTRLLDRPAQLQDRIFRRIFEVAEVANFTPEERFAYEESLKVYRDNKNVVDTAYDNGIEKGRAEGMAKGMAKGIAKGRAEGRAEGARQTAIENARRMLVKGLPKNLISEITGLRVEEIATL